MPASHLRSKSRRAINPRITDSLLAAILLVAAGCGRSRPDPASITVAAAANLTDAFEEIGKAFDHRTGIHVIYSFSATAQLARQIENGAPFDIFAAADTQHVVKLLSNNLLQPGSTAIYARGRLALWAPKGQIRSLADLARSQVKTLAIAKPDAAPYGMAAIETLKASGLWTAVVPKVVYANSIGMAKQFAATGNADVAFTAYSLVLHETGTVIRIDEKLHAPLDQSLGILTTSRKTAEANRFRAFVLGGEGRRLLAKYGYQLP